MLVKGIFLLYLCAELSLATPTRCNVCTGEPVTRKQLSRTCTVHIPPCKAVAARRIGGSCNNQVTIEKPSTEAVTTEKPIPEVVTTETPTTEVVNTEGVNTEELTTIAVTTEEPTTEVVTTEVVSTKEPTTDELVTE